MVRKIFTNIFIFLIVFAAISIAADVCFQGRNTRGEQDVANWDGRPDFGVFWVAANSLTHHILRMPNGRPAFLPFYPLRRGSRNNLSKSAKPGQYPLYDKKQTFYHFRYSPFIAFAMIPFVLIPYPPAALFSWSLMLNVVYLASLLLLAKQLHNDFRITLTHRYIVLWGTFVATMRYYLMNIGQGQTDVLVAFLFVLFLMAYIRNNDILCGVIFALVLQIKLLFLPMLVYFLFRRKTKLAISTVASFAAFLLIPACMLGLSETASLVRGWGEILAMSVPSQIQNFKNQSIVYAISVLLFKNSTIKALISPKYLIYSLGAVLTLFAYAATLWFGNCRRARDEKKYKYLEISILIMASLIFSPIAWEAHFVSLMIPLAAAIFFTLNSPKKTPLYAALGSYFVLSCAIGTDLTKYVPVLNALRFTNISLGTIFLTVALIYSFTKTQAYTAGGSKNENG